MAKKKKIGRLLITGGTGTIGRELIKRLKDNWQIAVVSRDEVKQANLKVKHPDLEYHIGDVRDPFALTKAMRGVDAVIHAAAMKRIEICEAQPIEAVKTNVIGSENVVHLAKEKGIKRLVSICTDKGVEPVNVYGMTKAIEERITIAAGYNAVRYGNVFGSTGSVIPLFYRQKLAGGPLTVTDPEMTRFLLTTDDAIDLIMMAFNRPMEGKIYVKKSPSTKIGDLAAAFEMPIKVIGKTRGEKKHEMLISEEETTRVKEEKGYFVVHPNTLTSKFDRPYTSDRERLLSVKEIQSLIDKWVAAGAQG